jgi:hypothetical protein
MPLVIDHAQSAAQMAAHALVSLRSVRPRCDEP